MRALLLLLLLGIATAVPTIQENNTNEVMIVDSNFYPTEFIKYRSEHDIVNILVPLNSLNFNKDPPSESNTEEKVIIDLVIFFAEADISENGTKSYKGVSVMKGNKVTKLLENGRDMAASGDLSKMAFIGASDGIYVYKGEQKAAVEKFGSINDDIIGIAKEGDGDVIYILTANKEVYNVTEKGTVKQKIEDIVSAEQIMLDYYNNIYFYSSDKQLYVRTNEGVKKIKGLPENPTYVQLIKPALVMREFVPLVVNNCIYLIYTNNTSAKAGIDFKEIKYMPTAYFMEATIVQYYAHEKKIYEYNMLEIISGAAIKKLKTFFDSKNIRLQDLITIKHKNQG